MHSHGGTQGVYEDGGAWILQHAGIMHRWEATSISNGHKLQSDKKESDEQSAGSTHDDGRFLLFFENPINQTNRGGFELAAGKIQSNRVEGQPTRLERFVEG
jgi:hypothetical protein